MQQTQGKQELVINTDWEEYQMISSEEEEGAAEAWEEMKAAAERRPRVSADEGDDDLYETPDAATPPPGAQVPQVSTVKNITK